VVAGGVWGEGVGAAGGRGLRLCLEKESGQYRDLTSWGDSRKKILAGRR